MTIYTAVLYKVVSSSHPFKKQSELWLSKSSDYQCALVMDKLKIKSGLAYRKHTGELVGFCVLGKVN